MKICNYEEGVFHDDDDVDGNRHTVDVSHPDADAEAVIETMAPVMEEKDVYDVEKTIIP